MAYDFNKIAVPQETTVEIYDAHGKKAGLRVTILPDTDENYRKVWNWAKSKYKAARNKKLPESKENEIEEKLFCARIGAWEWHGPLKDAAEDFPRTPAKVREFFFSDHSFSVMAHKQVSEAMTDESNFTESA